MRIQIRRYKVTVHDDPEHDNYIVESSHPDDAMAKVRFDLQLPIGTKLSAKEISSRYVETDRVKSN